MDMDIYRLKSVDINTFSKKPDDISSLITELCEIHASASIFGGIDNICF